MSIDRSQFGWASVQLDGGIEKVTSKVITWFENQFSQESMEAIEVEASLGALRISISCPTHYQVLPMVAKAFAQVTRSIVDSGGKRRCIKSEVYLKPKQLLCLQINF